MSEPKLAGIPNLVLRKTPCEIAISVAHKRIQYGTILEQRPELVEMLKSAIYRAVRDAIIDAATKESAKE